MAEVWTMGEMIVEIMRTEVDVSLFEAGLFKGPFPSGAPAIFIDTVAKLGHSAAIIGGVGNDEFGDCLLDKLKRDGVDCSKVMVSDTFATGVAFVTYFSDGSRKFIFHMGNTPAVDAKAPESKDLSGIKYFHIMGCSLMAKPSFAEEIIKTMRIAKSLNAKVSFDPNIRKELLKDASAFDTVKEVMRNTNIFLPGVEELLMVTQEQTIEEAVKKCFENPEMEIIVLKNGSKGCLVYTRTQSFIKGVYPVEVVDSTGAGDSFDAAFICGLLEGKDLEAAASMAAAAGALNTAAFGPMEGNISAQTVEQMICNHEK